MSPRRRSAAAAGRPGAEADGWLRARRPEHKRERREAILAAAVDLLDAEGVEGATLSAIARGTGLSKANCYRYFESREAILLAVTLDEVAAWTGEIEAGLAALAGSGDIDAAAEIFVGSTVSRPRVCMLASALSSVIERNVGPDTVAAFKRGVQSLMGRTTIALGAALPALPSDAARSFVSLFPLVLAGVWPAANPAPIVAEVLEREEFAGVCVDLESTLRMHARALLRGLGALRRTSS